MAVGSLCHLSDLYCLTMNDLKLDQLSACAVLIRVLMKYHSLYRGFASCDPQQAIHVAIEPFRAPRPPDPPVVHMMTLWVWCESHGRFEARCRLYVLELYPYAEKP